VRATAHGTFAMNATTLLIATAALALSAASTFAAEGTQTTFASRSVA
jgi:hypothetical protein